MKKGSKKFLIGLVSALLVAAVGGQIYFASHGGDMVKASFFALVRDMAEKNAPAPVDLGIENVSMKKVQNPKDGFNYYKYEATIVVKNYGGNLVNGNVKLQVEPGQKQVMLRNDEDGFTLLRDKSYIIRGYEVLFDANYNGGKFNFSLDLTDEDDYFEENNQFSVDVFEYPAKIEGVTYDLGFKEGIWGLRDHDVKKMMISDEELEGNKEYAESIVNDEVFGFEVMRSSKSLLDEEFVERAIDDPTHGYVKVVNPVNGYFAVSNIVDFQSNNDEINRAQMAELFVRWAGLESVEPGFNLYEDVNDGWYADSVQTLYNEGLLGFDSESFNAGEIVSREEVLKLVLDYYDVDLTEFDLGSGFSDVSSDALIGAYAQSLYESAGERMGTKFAPKKPATKSFLKFLIDEYSENN